MHLTLRAAFFTLAIVPPVVSALACALLHDPRDAALVVSAGTCVGLFGAAYLAHSFGAAVREAAAVARALLEGDEAARIALDSPWIEVNALRGSLNRTFDSLLAAKAEAQARSEALRVAGEEQRRIAADLAAFRQACDRAAIVALTDVQGNITDANENFSRISGYAREELLGENHRLLNSGAHDTAFFRDLWRTIAGGDVWKGEICNQRKDGSRYWVDTAIAPVLSDDARPRAYVALRFDVTERVEAAARLTEVNEQLASRVGELDALNQELESFSYSVSHDLRAPLHSIDGFSQILLDDYADALDETGADFLRRVRAAAQRMGALIDDMLALSRVTRRELRRADVDLSAVARDIVAELRRLEPERAVEVDIAPDLRAWGDPTLLRNLLQILLDNAWKFSGKRPDARIELGHAAENRASALFVRDNGAGFDMQYAGKLFAPFQRLHADGDFPGTGVGLATAQRIASRHGGRIWAESAPDEGATFFVELKDPQGAQTRSDA